MAHGWVSDFSFIFEHATNVRLAGFYEPFRVNINRAFGLEAKDQRTLTSMVAGAASGAVGGTFIVV